MKNLQVYRYVDAVDRYGSIRKAAEQLAITPSALNRRVLALEDELGVPIFERLGRGVRLSAAGELVVHVFRRQLARRAANQKFPTFPACDAAMSPLHVAKRCCRMYFRNRSKRTKRNFRMSPSRCWSKMAMRPNNPSLITPQTSRLFLSRFGIQSFKLCCPSANRYMP